jgi:F0F1-type ATP synthase delta subunit
VPKILIFSDDTDKYKEIRGHIKLFPVSLLESFNMSQALSEWSTFQFSGELLSSFESKQIVQIFKKFVKCLMTSKPITSLEKLINLTQNLVKAHLNTLTHKIGKI